MLISARPRPLSAWVHAMRWGLWLVGLAVGLASAAGASAADVFTVREVGVDVSAATPTEARELALAEGQAKAFGTLLQRLTLEVDWPRLPSAASVDLPRLISGFTVADERASATRYLAKISYDFEPDEVRAMLSEAGIPFAETRAKAIVVLPVTETPDGARLVWEPDNVWAELWRNKSLDQLLVPLIVPIGDLGDVGAAAALSIANPDWAGIAGLAARYGATGVVMPVLSLRPTATFMLADVRVYDLKPEGNLERRFAFHGVDETIVMEEAMGAVVGAIQEVWKSANVVLEGTASHLEADILFKGLPQWLSVKATLETVPTIRAMQIVGLAVDGARVNLSFVGTADQLAVSLAQSDLTLSPTVGGGWVISSLDALDHAPAPAPDGEPDELGSGEDSDDDSEVDGRSEDGGLDVDLPSMGDR